jgi:hypothetical protein
MFSMCCVLKGIKATQYILILLNVCFQIQFKAHVCRQSSSQGGKKTNETDIYLPVINNMETAEKCKFTRNLSEKDVYHYM